MNFLLASTISAFVNVSLFIAHDVSFYGFGVFFTMPDIWHKEEIEVLTYLN